MGAWNKSLLGSLARIKAESVGTFVFSLELGLYFCDNDVEQLKCRVSVTSKLQI